MMRIAAFFLILILTLTQALSWGTHPAFAQQASEESFTPRGEVFPPEIGRLREVYFPARKYQAIYQKDGLNEAVSRISEDGQPLVFLIEDAHSSIEAQRNIAALIRFIRSQWQVKILALEGASGEITLDEIKDAPLTKLRQEVLDFYLQEALLSGPEYEALRSPEHYLIRGVEQQDLYEADRKVYLELFENRHTIQKKIHQAKRELADKKAEIYSPELLSFDKKEAAFLGNPSRYLTSFVPYLIQTASQQGLKPASDSPLTLIERVLRTAQNISLNDLGQELILFKKENPVYKEEIEIIERKFLPNGFEFNFELTGPPPELPTLFLYRYGSIRGYLDLAEMRYEMDAPQVFSEIEDFIQKTKQLLIRNPEEKKLDERSRTFDALKQILYLEARRGDLETEGVRGLAEELDLTQDYEKAVLFYQLAEKRDEIMTLNTLQVIGEAGVSPKAAILVAGGFHTKGVQEILKNSKVAYIVVSPQFQSDFANERLYRMRLGGDLSLLTETA